MTRIVVAPLLPRKPSEGQQEVPTDAKLHHTEQRWFFPNMNSREAVTLLQRRAPKGGFIVTPSPDDAYRFCIVVRQPEGVRTVEARQDMSRAAKFHLEGHNESFPTLAALIVHFSLHPFHTTREGEDVFFFLPESKKVRTRAAAEKRSAAARRAAPAAAAGAASSSPADGTGTTAAEMEEMSRAATKIQANFRGVRVRREVERIHKAREEEARAATKIQASFRGAKARKEYAKLKEEDGGHQRVNTAASATTKSSQGSGATSRSAPAPKEVPDDEAHAAATKIQAGFRGAMARKEVEQRRTAQRDRQQREEAAKEAERQQRKLAEEAEKRQKQQEAAAEEARQMSAVAAAAAATPQFQKQSSGGSAGDRRSALLERAGSMTSNKNKGVADKPLVMDGEETGEEARPRRMSVKLSDRMSMFDGGQKKDAAGGQQSGVPAAGPSAPQASKPAASVVSAPPQALSGAKAPASVSSSSSTTSSSSATTKLSTSTTTAPTSSASAPNTAGGSSGGRARTESMNLPKLDVASFKKYATERERELGEANEHETKERLSEVKFDFSWN